MKKKHRQTDRRRQTSGAESYSSGKPRKHFQKLPRSPGMLSCVMVYMFVCLCLCVCAEWCSCAFQSERFNPLAPADGPTQQSPSRYPLIPSAVPPSGPVTATSQRACVRVSLGSLLGKKKIQRYSPAVST